MGNFSKTFAVAWAAVGLLLLVTLIVGLGEFLYYGGPSERMWSAVGLGGWGFLSFLIHGVITQCGINLKY